ncbi:MAG: hypothetical protein VXY61_04535 [Bacteroidota bacterium]|nr:hypothetical protein [Bacteroidota bacterium]
MRRPGPESNPRALAGWALLGLIGLWGWSGCKAPETADPGAVVVATAYGDALTVANLLAEVPPGLTARDSAGWADRVIADWQQRRTLVHLAKTELPEMELDFEREVAKYRETLYLHAYEDRYLRDHLDTAISVAELQAFLDEQPDLFRLVEPLYRARWMVFPDEAAFPRDIRGLQKQLASKDPEELSSLASRCADAGLPFDLDAERWWTWEELGSVVPLDPRKAARQQSSRRVTKIDWPADTAAGRPLDQRALLLVTERLASGAVSPVERVADRISELLLHRRRNRTLADMRQQAVQAAWAEDALSKTAPASTTDPNSASNDTP